MTDPFARLRHIVLDMDGTIYLGRDLFPETGPFLALLSELGIGYSFFTNNNSKSRRDYVQHLSAMGVDVPPERIAISTHATVYFLRAELPEVQRLFVLGTQGLREDLELEGYACVDESPQAVVVGFDRTLTYARLCQGAYLIAQGLPYVATHPDLVCPTNEPTVLPDCGAICALLERATGRRPDAVPGKPDPTMLRCVMDQFRLRPHEVALVGDRLYTDIRMARDAGICGVLTLTGESTRAQAEELPTERRPLAIVANLAELAALLRNSRRLAGRRTLS